MLHLELHRVEQDATVAPGRKNRRTRGSMFLNGNLECHILEDEVRIDDPTTPTNEGAKIMEETAIPAGTYRVVMVPSPKFGRVMPRLVDVPGFTGILIHAGHDEKDTWGCLMTAGGFDRDGDIIGGSSRPAFNALFSKLQAASARGEDIDITITNDFLETGR
jgi:hypothetical protein